MVLGFVKWLKGTSFCERKKVSWKHELCTKGKFILRRKKKFRIKKMLILWIFGRKKKIDRKKKLEEKINKQIN